MNKYFYKLFLITIVIVSCNNYNPSIFNITGKLINNNTEVVKLVAFVNDSNITVVDSAVVNKNGSFELKTFANTEALYALKLNHLPYIFIANDVNKIEVEIDAKKYNNYKIKNSPNSQNIKDYFEKYQALEVTVNRAKDSIAKAKKSNVSDSILTILKQQEQTAINTLKTFCASSINKAEGAALKFLTIYYGFKTNNINNQQAAIYISDAVKKFNDNHQINALNESMLQIIAVNPETVLLNKSIVPFTIKSTIGDTIDSKKYVGKYVLLQFWTSYNKTFRNETIQLIETYKQFKDTNFSIIGISLDSNYKAAIKAIKTDSLIWRNSIDTLGLQSELAKKYYVKNLPFNVLINPQQKIIAVNLTNNALQEKLKALYQR
ncbi:MAG: thioredoxin-like domain-containing protein [Chitinophagaceae bacterium]